MNEDSADASIQDGDLVAVKSSKYTERPLIGQVTSTTQKYILVYWNLLWHMEAMERQRWWKTVTSTKTIDKTDIIQKVSFTKSIRLSTATVTELKTKYKLT